MHAAIRVRVSLRFALPVIECGPWRRVGSPSAESGRRGTAAAWLTAQTLVAAGYEESVGRAASRGAAGRCACRREHNRGRVGGRKIEATAMTRGERSIPSFVRIGPDRAQNSAMPRERLPRSLGQQPALRLPLHPYICCVPLHQPPPYLGSALPVSPASLARPGQRPEISSHAPSRQPGLQSVPCPLSAGRRRRPDGSLPCRYAQARAPFGASTCSSESIHVLGPPRPPPAVDRTRS